MTAARKSIGHCLRIPARSLNVYPRWLPSVLNNVILFLSYIFPVTLAASVDCFRAILAASLIPFLFPVSWPISCFAIKECVCSQDDSLWLLGSQCRSEDVKHCMTVAGLLLQSLPLQILFVRREFCSVEDSLLLTIYHLLFYVYWYKTLLNFGWKTIYQYLLPENEW